MSTTRQMRNAAKSKPRTTRQARKIVAAPPRKPGNAIVVASPSIKPWELNSEEVAILKNAVAKGATDEEFKYCLNVARRYKADPFQKQIWFVPRWDSRAEQSDGAQGGKVWVPIMGIDGLRHIAARDHADYGTFSEPEYGPMIEVAYQRSGRGPFLKLKVPEWARIESFKKGIGQPTIAKVWWEEIYPDIDYAPLVRRMPRLMLAKCAMAQAIRANYPSTGGLLIPEETHNREFTQFTPEGRLITPAEPENKHLAAYHEREQKELSRLTPAQQEILKAKMQKAGESNVKSERLSDSGDSREVLQADSSAQKSAIDAVPCLFYRYFPESETYLIDGAQELKTANKDLLGPLWNGAQKAIIATPAELGKLISQLEYRKVCIRELKNA